MTEETTVNSFADIPLESFSNKDAFQKMVAEAKGEPQPVDEQGEQEESEAEDTVAAGEGEEQAQESEEEQPGDAEDDEEEKEQDKTERKLVSPAVHRAEKERRRAESARADKAEAELQKLIDAIEKFSKPAEPQEEQDEFEPLDPETDKRTKAEIKALQDKIDQLERGGEVQKNVMAIQSREMTLNSELSKEYQTESGKPYFEAIDYLMGQIAEEQQSITGGEIEDILPQVAQQLFSTSAEMLKKGQDAPKIFFDMAKRRGWNAKPTVKKKAEGAKPDAIAANRRLGERKASNAENPGHGTALGALAAIEQMGKGGRGVDPAKFAALIAQTKGR